MEDKEKVAQRVRELFQMGDLVRLVGGLRSCVDYLAQRGGGPRLTAVQGRLQEIEAELARVAG